MCLKCSEESLLFYGFTRLKVLPKVIRMFNPYYYCFTLFSDSSYLTYFEIKSTVNKLCFGARIEYV